MKMLLSCSDGVGAKWQLWREFEWYWVERSRMNASQYPSNSFVNTESMRKGDMYRWLLVGPELPINSSQARWEEFATLAIQKMAFEGIEL